MSKLLGKSSKPNRRYGDITIRQRDASSRIRNALGQKIERDKKRRGRKGKIEELVAKHPNKSLSTIRTWMYADSELERDEHRN